MLINVKSLKINIFVEYSWKVCQNPRKYLSLISDYKLWWVVIKHDKEKDKQTWQGSFFSEQWYLDLKLKNC